MPDFQCSVSGCEDYDVEWAARVRKGPVPPAGPPPRHMLKLNRPIERKSYGTAAPAEPPLGHMRGTAGPDEAVGRKKSYRTTAPAEPPLGQRSYGIAARDGPPCGQQSYRTPRAYRTPAPVTAPAGPVTPPAGPAEAAGPKKSYCIAAPVTSPDRRLARSRSPPRSRHDIPEWCQERLKVAAVLAASDSNLRHYSTDSLILELYRRTFQT